MIQRLTLLKFEKHIDRCEQFFFFQRRKEGVACPCGVSIFYGLAVLTRAISTLADKNDRDTVSCF